MIAIYMARQRAPQWAFNLATKSLVLLCLLVPMTRANTDQDPTAIEVTAAAATAVAHTLATQPHTLEVGSALQRCR